MIVRSPARQGMRGSLATDGVVRRRRNTWPGRQWSRWKSAVSMWLKGHGGSTFGLCLASPAAGCPGRTTMTRYWSPLSAAHRHGWWACCVGGAGRDLRHVGVRGGESVWGRAAGRALMLRSASSSVASWRSGMTRFSAAGGGGRADGRGVVMICDGPRARRWWGKAHDSSGLVLVQIGFAGGHFEMVRFAVGRLAAARLSRSCHKWCETWWDGGRYVETIFACRREETAGTGGHGFSLTGGQVVAGSNPVSPTRITAGQTVNGRCHLPIDWIPPEGKQRNR